MDLRLSISAIDLDAQIDSILKLVEKRAAKNKHTALSRHHDRDSVALAIRCAIAAEAIDKDLERTLITVSGMGRVVTAEGPAIIVCRLAWDESMSADWPRIIQSNKPIPGHDNLVLASAEFTDAADEALQQLMAQPWFLTTTMNTQGTITAHLNGQALAELVEVIGANVPTLSEAHDASSLAPTLGGNKA